ncbi:MAG: hypothetical protein ACK4RV_11680 [Caulobacter sp.]
MSRRPPRGFDQSLIDLEATRRRARVSDHAVVRFLERAQGFPIELIRQSILRDEVVGALALGATSVTVDGLTYRLAEDRVVNVLKAGDR